MTARTTSLSKTSTLQLALVRYISFMEAVNTNSSILGRGGLELPLPPPSPLRLPLLRSCIEFNFFGVWIN